MSSYVGLGVMSGTSLDGVDLCCAEFTGDVDSDFWSYRILRAETFPYEDGWAEKLKNAATLSGAELIKLHTEYGHYLGKMIAKYIEENDLAVQFISCHGHTVFHQPESGFTFQLGCGESLASHMTHTTVTNFRPKDVALGGQGAPLVPSGENYLFSQYHFCLNLGGIANISIEDTGFDVGPCNMLLNYLSLKLDPSKDYDVDGAIAKEGRIIEGVLRNLNNLPFYSQAAPKSLGKEWFDAQVVPLLDLEAYSVKDLLRTSVEHITDQILKTIGDSLPDGDTAPKSLLITGGGALNNFLIETLRDKLEPKLPHVAITECDSDTINFKEALVFAYLGLRLLLGISNISSKVTGARMDSLSGSIHVPPKGSNIQFPGSPNYAFNLRRSSSAATSPLPGHGTFFRQRSLSGAML